LHSPITRENAKTGGVDEFSARTRLARDYERMTATSEAMIKVAMIRLMLARLTRPASRWSTAEGNAL